MPYLYLTGVNSDGRSCVLDRHEVGLDSAALPVRSENAGEIAAASSRSVAPLLVSMTEPGSWFGNIYPWKPGMYTDLHRTISTDFDVVLSGSVEMTLEVGTVLLEAGDCVFLPGTVHAWKAGPKGGIMAFTMVAGEPTAADIGRRRGSHDSIAHGDH